MAIDEEGEVVGDIPDMPEPTVLEDDNIKDIKEILVFPNNVDHLMSHETIFNVSRRFIMEGNLLSSDALPTSSSSLSKSDVFPGELSEKCFQLLR